MSQTELVQTSTIRVGQYIVIDGKPCKVIAVSTAKPGKHGASKTMFDTKDLLSGKNVQTSAASKGTIEVPEIVRENYTVIGVSNDGFMTLERNGNIRQDVRLPANENGDLVHKMIKDDKYPEIVLMTVLGYDIIVSVRESSE